jgi:chaperone required for assembly of F1-ATPase
VKRFWDHARVAADDDGWCVLLDEQPLRVPGGPRLHLGSRKLAEAVAAEWQQAGGGKGGQTSFADLPLTRLAGTAQERVAVDPEPVVLAIADYAVTDLLCYRAERPDRLARRQAACWQPWLDWAERRWGAHLEVTRGVMPVAQDPAATAALAARVAAQPADAIAALGVMVPALGSLVLGLAVADGALAAEAAFELSVLDERVQAEDWGKDAEAQARLARIRQEVVVAGRFIELARA